MGKSTFLKVLTGSLELAAGSVRLGDTVRIGYYEQVSRNVTCQTCQTSIVMHPFSLCISTLTSISNTYIFTSVMTKYCLFEKSFTFFSMIN